MLTSYNAVSLDSYLYTVLEIYKSEWEHNLDSVVGSVSPLESNEMLLNICSADSSVNTWTDIVSITAKQETRTTLYSCVAVTKTQ